MKKLIAAAAVLFALTACGEPTVKVSKLGSWQAQPHTREVTVYRTEADVTRAYREIALLTADDNALDLAHKLRESLKIKAQQIGADAVIILDEEQVKARGPQFKWTLIVPPAEHNLLHAVAIVYE